MALRPFMAACLEHTLPEHGKTYTQGRSLRLINEQPNRNEMEGFALPRDEDAIASVPSKWPDNGHVHEDNHRIRDMVAMALTSRGIPAQGPSDLTGAQATNKTWTVMEDPSIQGSPEEVKGKFYKWNAVEVITGIMDDPTDHGTLKKGLDILHENFVMGVNGKCGLHVHVGVQHHGFPLRTLQNLAALVTAFEDRLASLHPQERHRGDYCKGPADKAEATERGKVLAQHRVIEIFETFTFAQLKSLAFTRKSDSAYNFNNAIPPPGELKQVRTVEFRQAAGSFDWGYIYHWLKVVTGLVRFACSADEKQLTKLFLKMGDANYGIIELLRGMDITDAADYFSLSGRLHDLDPELQRPQLDEVDKRKLAAAIAERPAKMEKWEKTCLIKPRKMVPIERVAKYEYKSLLAKDLIWVPYEGHPYKDPPAVVPAPDPKYVLDPDDEVDPLSNNTYGSLRTRR